MNKQSSIIVLLVLFTISSICGQAHTSNDATPMVNSSIQTTVDSNNAFAFRLYKTLQADKNLFFSPFSISSALAMTYAGARNETERQMSHVLGFSLNQDNVHNSFEDIIKSIESDAASGLSLSIANSLWAQNDYRFLPSYFDLVKAKYYSELTNVDFISETEKARREINAWAEQKTNKKIKDILPQGSIDDYTRLVLVNAIYFNGKWATEFSKNNTRKDIFRVAGDSADFMHITEHINYYEDDEYQAVDIPYKNNKVSMLVFLPRKMYNNGNTENDLKYGYYAKVVHSMRSEQVVLSLPKFKATQSFDLKATLSSMGMPIAFGQFANFSGMTGDSSLYISKVLHKAFIDVKEEGTEAAAAVIMTGKCMAMPSRPKVFNADHPFFFVIRDDATGSILFMGKIMEPDKSE